MTNVELARAIRSNLFADRKTLKEAWDYVSEVMNRLNHGDNIAATTAMMVLLNTISNQILANEGK